MTSEDYMIFNSDQINISIVHFLDIITNINSIFIFFNFDQININIVRRVKNVFINILKRKINLGTKWVRKMKLLKYGN